MILWSLKYISGLIVRLKAIEYKEDFFCYLFSYPDLGLQATCFQILSFRPYAFRFFLLGYMPSRFLTKYIYLSIGFQICFNNLNLVPYIESLIDQIPKAYITAMNQLFSCYCIKLQLGRSNTKKPYLLYPTSCTFITCIIIPKA